jgi:uncharacterized protein (DUF1015 family)
MSVVKPFRGLRPKQEYAEKVASPPYDVLNSQEAKDLAGDNPYSFLHVVKPEIDLPEDINIYDKRVYEKGAENLQTLIKDEIMIKEDQPCFYIYKQIMGDHEQVGLVAGASVEEYEKDLIKKHEKTRKVKEDDRTNHVNHLNANTGPVFLTYHAREAIDTLMNQIMETSEPVYNFTSNDGIEHIFWIVSDDKEIKSIENEFAKLGCLYVADGHHRSASAARVKEMRQKENPDHTGDEEYNYFLTVIFPHNQMYIMDYNRVVKDLDGNSKEEFLIKVEEKFEVEFQREKVKPEEKHTFGMYLDGDWYKLTSKAGTYNETDPVGKLDVSILQENLLTPILGIGDPRKDERIDFVGGIRGLEELERLVDSGKFVVAFAMHPTSIEELMAIADANLMMPPKSTWFEPKLRSGLIVHMLD